MNLELYRSSFVQRWHTDPLLARLGQTNGHHQWGVGLIILLLHPAPSAGLLLVALTHDAGEIVTGDAPWVFKKLCPEISGPLEAQTDEVSEELRGVRIVLTPEEETWLGFADRLESLLYVYLMDPQRLYEWRPLINRLRGQSFALGVADKVEALLQEMGL